MTPMHDAYRGEGRICARATDLCIPSMLTLHSHSSLIILASCMHAGTRIVRLQQAPDDGEWRFEVLARFEEHKSMNYGSDVQPSEQPTKKVVSTSFYDKLLCVWTYDLQAAT